MKKKKQYKAEEYFHFGASRPDWIERDVFVKSPFNYCDSWCERCEFASICKIYIQGQEDRKSLIKEGKDPDSLESALEMVSKNFRKTIKMLVKSADEMGIDLNEEDRELEMRMKQMEKEARSDELYKILMKYSEKVKKFLDSVEFVSIEADSEVVKEMVEVLSFYVNLIPVKIYRGVHSKIEESMNEDDWINDSKTQGFLVIRALLNIAFSLRMFRNESNQRQQKGKIDGLMKLTVDLAKCVDEYLETKQL